MRNSNNKKNQLFWNTPKLICIMQLLKYSTYETMISQLRKQIGLFLTI